MKPKYKWNLREKNDELISDLTKKYKFSTIIATILANRNIVMEDEIRRFLNVDKDKFYDPYLLKDMDKAVDRIIKAIENKENIIIYGDYDVDGITSTSILYMFLEENGVDVDYYIPNRLKEGYGLNNDAIESIYNNNTQLLITVDTGITAIGEVEYANELGLDIIITDHHECLDEIPSATAVIDPKRKDCDYPFDMLAGVGVAFKLIHALSIKLDVIDSIWKYLDIVAVGTVADIVPLIDENRIITKLAFETMQDTWNIGLKSLIKVAGTNKDGRISAGIIGFRIAPRLNAAGRLGEAKKGVELFITKDKDRAANIADSLNEENLTRQELEQNIYNEAINIIEKSIDIDKTKVIVISSNNWHHGVIGIVASRITEKYYRPCILLNIEDNIATGSARSVEGFNIFEALCSVKDVFIKFGGHEMAAGMSLKEELINELRIGVNRYAQDTMKSDTLIPKLTADMEIDINKIDISLIEEIIKLEPYGVGNPEPKFICKGKVNDVRKIGKDNSHIKMVVKYNENYLDGIGFGMGEYYDSINVSNDISLLGTLNINEWNGTKKPQIMLKDISTINEFNNNIQKHYEVFRDMCKTDFNQEHISFLRKEKLIPVRDEFETVYRALLTQEKNNHVKINVVKLMNMIKFNKSNKAYTLLICLKVFQDLNLLSYQFDGMDLSFSLNKGMKVRLDESNTYKKLNNN